MQGAKEKEKEGGHSECNNDYAEVHATGLTEWREAVERTETQESPNVMNPVQSDTLILLDGSINMKTTGELQV